MNIAYLIIAHKDIHQVYRLIDRLDAENVYFFIHVKQSYQLTLSPEYAHKKNVVFIDKRFNAGWCGYKVLLATLELIKTALMQEQRFDYFINLSGNCYPIVSNEAIHDYLNDHAGSNFIEGRPLTDSKFPDNGMNKINLPWFQDEFQNFNSYIKKGLHQAIQWPYRLFNLTRKLPGHLLPYGGSQWWALTHEVVQFIYNSSLEHPKLVNFFKRSWCSDELYIQMILYNNDDFKEKLINKPFRFMDWNTNGPPKTLTLDDYDRLMASDHVFARKFDPIGSADLIILLDRQI